MYSHLLGGGTMISDLLQLSSYTLDSIAVRPNSRYKRTNDASGVTGKIALDADGPTEAGPNSYTLSLDVRIAPLKGHSNRLPYYVQVAGTATFWLPTPESLDSDGKNRVLLLNGSSILYGMLRTHVAELTALGRNGQLLMPTLNLVDAFEAETEADVSEVQGEAMELPLQSAPQSTARLEKPGRTPRAIDLAPAIELPPETRRQLEEALRSFHVPSAAIRELQDAISGVPATTLIPALQKSMAPLLPQMRMLSETMTSITKELRITVPHDVFNALDRLPAQFSIAPVFTGPFAEAVRGINDQLAQLGGSLADYQIPALSRLTSAVIDGEMSLEGLTDPEREVVAAEYVAANRRLMSLLFVLGALATAVGMESGSVQSQVAGMLMMLAEEIWRRLQILSARDDEGA
jgi:hypothetical protein